jgi:DNA-directed RNA polymerase subunit RPC12/RpoP
MNIDELRERFGDEALCRQFFESIIWPKGRRCPHCGHDKSWRLKAARPGVYECSCCKRQFTVTRIQSNKPIMTIFLAEQLMAKRFPCLAKITIRWDDLKKITGKVVSHSSPLFL